MKSLRTIAAGIVLAALLCGPAAAAELAGQWTTDGRYVFTFARAGESWTGTVIESATGREFKLADIVVDGSRVSFCVVHDAAWARRYEPTAAARSAIPRWAL